MLKPERLIFHISHVLMFVLQRGYKHEDFVAFYCYYYIHARQYEITQRRSEISTDISAHLMKCFAPVFRCYFEYKIVLYYFRVMVSKII